MRTDDSGAATVWAAIAMAALLAVATVLFSLGSVMVTRQRAADTADLAALAAAGGAARGGEVACERANSIATKAAVRLVTCRLDGWDALIEVEAAAPAGLGVASAHARAGPVSRGTPASQGRTR
ncbi:Rv3654c family TadE-like protein [Amycolatopsis pigmentata]|uniref:Rv3654c family TadE-like protein n=1 Tax=Amycolatopsis pigmentata TaxID=450801 RepID=A0ABW5FS20_9PSEU